MNIRLLNRVDWQIWKLLRLEALRLAPEAFGSAFEEESKWSDAEFQDSLIKSDIFGAFIDDELVGCAGFYSLNLLKTKHRGVLWGMYIKGEYRGKGIATSLMQVVVEHAKSRVIQLHLTCVTGNTSAVKLYQSHGCKIYGTEPRALKIGDKFFDEHLMLLDLTNEY